VKSTFAGQLSDATGLAFQGVTLPVPEPSALGLLAVGVTALLVRRRCAFLTTPSKCKTIGFHQKSFT